MNFGEPYRCRSVTVTGALKPQGGSTRSNEKHGNSKTRGDSHRHGKTKGRGKARGHGKSGKGGGKSKRNDKGQGKAG